MAGALLLVRKNDQADDLFGKMCDHLKTQVGQTFSGLFKNIEYRQADRKSFLVIFKKADRDKFYSDGKGSWIVYEGTVFALRQTKLHSAQSLWDLYLEKGRDFFDELDGHFVIKLYDAQKDEYIIGNDIIKSRSTYLAENDKFIMFTPFLVTTAAVTEPQPDFDAFNEMFWRYYVLSKRTLFKNVRRLSPATILSVKNETVEEKTYWHFPETHTKLTFRETTKKLTESLQESARLINTILKKPVSDLTLGQDSRLIVASFLKQNLAIQTSTFGKDDFSEVQGVKALSQRNGIANNIISLSSDFEKNFGEYFKKTALLASSDEPGHILGRILFMREQQSQWGDGMLNGAGGPFYKDCFWEEFYTFNFYRESKQLNRQLFLKLRPLNKNYPDHFFSKKFLETKAKSADYFWEMFDESQQGIKEMPLSMQIDKFALTYWQNYAVRANDMANTVFDSFSPLLFRRNLEIGLPSPARWRWNKSNLQRAVMFAINSKLAKEPTDFGGINMMPKNIITFVPFYTRYVLRQTARMRNKILNKIGIQKKTHLQEAWDYLPIYKEFFKSDFVQRQINPEKMAISEILDFEKWNEWIAGFESGQQSLNNYELLFKIISMNYIFETARKFSLPE
ncbi:MAG: hypothetical protein KDF60_10815 [Calditrichaeota bacterium]|nr:hypothetical protein [Calditrichota bacterium]